MNSNTSKCSSDREPSRMPCPIDLYCKSVILLTVFICFNKLWVSSFATDGVPQVMSIEFAVLNLEYLFHNPLPNLFLSTGCPYKQTTSTPSSNTSDKSSSKASEVGDEVAGDFVVGECVWVNGVKPGVIAYLGETQFSPGQWAGVVLNDLVGKNDGSVNGVRYFECQPLQGIFTRPSKLTRQPIGDGSDEQQQNAQLQCGASGQRVVMPLREGMLNSSVKTGNESGSNMSDSGSVKKGGEKDLKVGDRVLVSVGSFSQWVY